MPKQKINKARELARFSPEEREELQKRKRADAMGRKDPVFFGEYHLGLEYHAAQKIWLWLTTKTQVEKAIALAEKEGIELPPTEGLRRHNYLKNILAPSNRFGKAQPLTEPVLTPTGWRKMGDIKKGMYVIAGNGKPTKVTNVYPQGEKEVYRLRFNDGSWTECCGEHLWRVMTPSSRFTKNYDEKGKEYPNRMYRKYETLSTKEIIDRWGLSPKPWQRVQIPMTSPVLFPVVPVPLDGYVLGLLLGDGGMTTNNVIFSTSDKELLQNFPSYAKRAGQNYDYGVHGLAPALRGLGLLGASSETKFIPREYLMNGPEERLALLQGLMDTDGCILENGVMEYCSVSEDLARGVVFLVQSLGGMAVLAEKPTTYSNGVDKKDGKTAFRVTIRMSICPFRLKRKRARFSAKHYQTTKNRILKSIEPIGKKAAQCIEVEDPSHLYLTRDFIVTHNTFVTSTKHIWMNYYKIGLEGAPDDIAVARYGTLNLSPHSLQVQAAYRYIIDIFSDRLLYRTKNEKGDWVMKRNTCRIKEFMLDYKDTKREVHFANNSKVKGAPTGEDQGSSIAGTNWAYISYDEAPQSSHLQDELPAKILSRLIDSGGACDIIGTPEVDKPSHAYFYRIAKYGKNLENGFFTLTGSIFQNRFIPEKNRKEVLDGIKSTDSDKYRQVAYGEFVASGGTLFDPQAIEMLFSDNIEKITHGKPDRDYCVSIDWGFSDDGDPTQIYVTDVTELRRWPNTDAPGPIYYTTVFEEEIQGGDPYVAIARVRGLQEDFNGATVIHDATSMGGTIIKKMFKSLDMRNVHDFGMYKSPKDEMLFLMYRAVNHGRVQEGQETGKLKAQPTPFGKLRVIQDPDLEYQLSGYKKNDKKLKQDRVMALGMMIWFYERRFSKKREPVYNVNIFAKDPKNVIKVKNKAIQNRSLNIKTRTLN